eukprot:TRINITY_DN12416_c0_g1_i2.p2 TRINITY_DN12416_c0_g1~~TRINITY_DN12416_c0_g1_i2.p2  ORF type:complete len:153 (-),score=20.77 TRINITY_DN12416_c0_g1_i2:1483-1941(-)
MHFLMIFPMPSKVVADIEQLMRGFLWAGGESKKKLKVSWKIVCLPKRWGGLGMQRLAEVNKACVLKLACHTTTSSSILATWFRCFKHTSLWDYNTTKLGSGIWKFIRKLGPFFKLNCQWKIGNGSSISLWYDRWLGDSYCRKVSSSLLLSFG